jgi:hypothetical protein
MPLAILLVALSIFAGVFRMKPHEQLRNSTPIPANLQHDEHRTIADAWLRSAIDGIWQMHLDEDPRREVAGRIF